MPNFGTPNFSIWMRKIWAIYWYQNLKNFWGKLGGQKVIWSRSFKAINEWCFKCITCRSYLKRHVFWAIWHFFQIGQKMAGCRQQLIFPKFVVSWSKFPKKCITSSLCHIKLFLVSIPMFLISMNWLKVSKVLKTSYKGESHICCELVKIFHKKKVA